MYAAEPALSETSRPRARRRAIATCLRRRAVEAPDLKPAAAAVDAGVPDPVRPGDDPPPRPLRQHDDRAGRDRAPPAVELQLAVALEHDERHVSRLVDV